MEMGYNLSFDLQVLNSMKKTNFLTLSHDYQMDKCTVLGKGSTGEVYLGKHLSSNQPVAIKLIRLETIDNQVTDYLLRMEKIALQTIVHENVMRGLKIIENASKCYMITEYCNSGTLKQLIKNQGALNQEKSLQIIKGILKGYNALVKNKIVHRDLKPANIMLHNNVPKIIDFGYCQIEGYQKPSLQYNVGSPSYMAPESFQNNIYNEKTQIWAIGIILYECLMGKTFDDGKHMSEVFKAIKKFGIPFGREVSDKCRRIVCWCLEFMPQKRPSTLELLNFLSQKKANEPEFFILQKNRTKANSLFVNQNTFQSTNFVTKRKFPVVEKRISSALYTPLLKVNQMQRQTVKNTPFRDQEKSIFQEPTKVENKRNSRSKEQYGLITKNATGVQKVQNMQVQLNKVRTGSNYIVANEYGLVQEPVFMTEKYFTGKTVHNKLPLQHVSSISSGLITPRNYERKQTQGNDFISFEQKNPQSGKHRVVEKLPLQFTPALHEAYFERNPSMTYRPSISQEQKFIKNPTKHQNFHNKNVQKQSALTTRLGQQYQIKHQAISHPNPSFSVFESVPVSCNRDRTSGSIYQLNNFLNDMERSISIFSSGRDFPQRTFR